MGIFKFICQSCSCGSSNRSTADTVYTRSKTTTFNDGLRSPTFLSCAEAIDGSSDRCDLSSYILSGYEEQQLETLLSFKQELVSFFDLWHKLHNLPYKTYLSFCSLFYLNLSPNFITQNAEAFLHNDDASKSGEFIMNQLHSTILKIQDIYAVLQESQNTPFVECLTDGISTDNKVAALRLMDKFNEYYLVHLRIGIHETMFDECCNSLEQCLDAITSSRSEEYMHIVPFTLSLRSGLRLFFEVTRTLMLQQDLCDLLSIFHSVNQKDKIQSLVANKILVQKFIAFWDFNIIHEMNQDEKELFSLKIYSYMIKKLQNDAAGINSEESETETQSNHDIINTDECVMQQFYQNIPFITHFSVGIISWLNQIVQFLKEDEPKQLFTHLRNIKRKYERMNVDIAILQPLLYAFKASCVDHKNFYIENKEAFHRSKLCILDEEMEECVDFVFNLIMDELLQNKDHSLIIDSSQNNNIINNGSSDDIHDNIYDLTYNSPIASPNSSLFQNANSSLLFWKANIQMESRRNIQKLHDKILEKISILAEEMNTNINFISNLSAQINTNINLIDFIDTFLFRKIEKYLRKIPNPKQFLFDVESVDDPDLSEKTGEIAAESADAPILRRVKSTISYSDKDRSRSADFYGDLVTEVTNTVNNRIIVDFVTLQKDKDIIKFSQFIAEHQINPNDFKLLRTAIIDVLQSYYAHTFNNVTKRNFTLLLRTFTSLIFPS